VRVGWREDVVSVDTTREGKICRDMKDSVSSGKNRENKSSTVLVESAVISDDTGRLGIGVGRMEGVSTTAISSEDSAADNSVSKFSDVIAVSSDIREVELGEIMVNSVISTTTVSTRIVCSAVLGRDISAETGGESCRVEDCTSNSVGEMTLDLSN